jgi:hypothetical protein
MASIEFVVIANHAEVQNGLLYLSGGGWSEHWRLPQPDGSVPTTKLGLGVSILTPWGDANRPVNLTLRVEHEDGGEPLAKLDAQMEVGRPPGLTAGSDLRSVLAANIDLMIPTPGGYRVVAELGDGEEEGSRRSASFRVHESPPPIALAR